MSESIFVQHPALLTPDERTIRAHRARSSGMFLDLRSHGDVAMLQTRNLDILFLSGLPAAFLNRDSGELFVSSDLKIGECAWERAQVESVYRRRVFTWTRQDAIFAALNRRTERE